MNRIATGIIVLLITVTTYAANDPGIISRQTEVRVSPLYQRWSMDGMSNLSEFSIPVQLYYPLRHNMSFSLQTGQANVSAATQNLNAFVDTQISLSYLLEDAGVIFNLGFNLPSGKSELTLREFSTVAILSQNFLDFQLPSFGQGFNVSPGFTWAKPLSEKLVVGLGASYQYKGEYTPLQNLDGYDPGDEVLFTGGFDWRLDETTTVTTDFIYTLYAADKIANDKIFSAGNKFIANVQYRQYFGHNELWLFGRYRGRSKNSVAIGGALLPESEKTTPNQLQIIARYRARFDRAFYLSFQLEERYFQKTTSFFSDINIFGGGIMPEIAVSSNVIILTQFKYFTGGIKDGPDFSGFEAGAGCKLSLE